MYTNNVIVHDINMPLQRDWIATFDLLYIRAIEFFFYVRDTHVFTIDSFFRHQKKNSRSDSRRRRRRTTGSAMSRYRANLVFSRWPLKSIPTIQIKFRSCSRWRWELSAAVISCGRRTIKQLRASNIVNTIYPTAWTAARIPGRLAFSLCRSPLTRVLCIGVLRSPDHNLTKIGSRREPTVVPACAIVQPLWSTPFNPEI